MGALQGRRCVGMRIQARGDFGRPLYLSILAQKPNGANGNISTLRNHKQKYTIIETSQKEPGTWQKKQGGETQIRYSEKCHLSVRRSTINPA